MAASKWVDEHNEIHYIYYCADCKFCEVGITYGEKNWCKIQYKSCRRGREDGADCGPDGKLWEEQ